MAYRKFINWLMMALASLSALISIFFLLWILKDLTVRGIAAINWDFFTKLPAPPGEPDGGIKHAIYGTFIITLMASAIAIPIGLLAGTYLSEYARHGRFGLLVRFLSDILLSVPSIIVGTFVYAIVVRPMGTFSALAGAIALAIIMIPIILKTTDEVLQLVPNVVREAAYALGAPRWVVITKVVYKGAITGIMTGIILGIARIIGETAPLLFTSFSNNFWETNIFRPMATMTVVIFNYAMSPYENWQSIAWGASFVLTVFVLVLNLLSRFIFRGRKYG